MSIVSNTGKICVHSSSKRTGCMQTERLTVRIQMKRIFVVVVLLLFVGFAPQMDAQQQSSQGQPSQLRQYEVQEGDTLWELSGEYLGSALLWELIYQANPFLRTSDRRFQQDGKTFVLLRQGEILNGLSPIGLQAVEEALFLSQLKSQTVEVESVPWWLWVLIVTLVVLFVVLYTNYFNTKSQLKEREIDLEYIKEHLFNRNVKFDELDFKKKELSDPVTSGTPMVTGGVTIEVRAATDQKPAMVRLIGVNPTLDNSVELTENSITVRFKRQ